jgi:GNAT superfamily N-acetyltransferase
MEISIAVSLGDITKAFFVVNEVFAEFVAPDYSVQGVAAFRKMVTKEFMHSLQKNNGFVLNAMVRSEVIGTIAVRDANHIALFFVKKDHQGKGVGKALYNKAKQMIKDAGKTVITVHSSPYAVICYEALEFSAVDTEKVENGIRYIPMEASIA